MLEYFVTIYMKEYRDKTKYSIVIDVLCLVKWTDIYRLSSGTVQIYEG